MKTMWLFLALVAGTISFNSVARSDFDHDQIRQLVDQGKILSLDAILKKYPQHNLGRLLDLEVECEHGLIIYELEFLQKMVM
ncbi:MAG: hypothetical protein JKY88_00140 [Pseudomonadales bacterium]|nr:hypothetical protein [Pseudomonadales bacterium]